MAATDTLKGEGTMRPPTIPPKRSSTSASTIEKKAGVKATKLEKEKSGRQTFSCAECRRLKLKCSREWPCTSCEKRGCAQICPMGEMRTGKGKRLILADTAELHQRISVLEVALSQAHARTTSAPHPLLESSYLFSPRESRQIKGGKSWLGSPSGEEELLEGAFGTLTIGQEGQATFVGSFAGSEYLRDGEESGDEDAANGIGPTNISQRRKELATPPATAQGRWESSQGEVKRPGLGLHSSLFAGGEVSYDLERLRAELPDYDLEGRAMVESYWENVNWQYQPLPRAMFENDHVLNAYDTEAPANPHKLACVFLVLALGSMFDLNRPPFHPRGEQLFLLGRACISIIDIEQASPATVQALHLMGTYILNDKRGNGAEVFWPILGTAVKIALSLGLHRDGAHYGLSQYEIEERRVVWWEVVTYDRLQSLCFGRPCATSEKWSDTKLPEVPELIGDESGFHAAKYGLIRLMERVIEIQTQVTPVQFNVVSQLDSDLRNFKKNLPENFMPNVSIPDLPLDPRVHPHLVIHRFGIRLQLAQMRLLLNRPLFARALKDSPEDPSHSKFGTSFVALFESAQEIVHLVKALVIYHPSLVARWWFFWFHAFSSAVCLAAIAIRAPLCAFASPAFHAMSIVCDIAAAAREGCRAKRGLPILIRLRKRAHDSLVAASRSKNKAMVDGSGDEDDLSHLQTSAKLRRVSANPRRRSVSSNGSGVAAGMGIVGIDTPSPNSGGSTGTSSTLVDTGLNDGAAPPFPNDQLQTPSTNRSMPNTFPGSVTSNSNSIMTSTSRAPEDSAPNLSINGAHSSSWNGLQSSPTTMHSNIPVSPECDGQMGVDMDMSMALGVGMGMGMGMPMGLNMGHGHHHGGLEGGMFQGHGNEGMAGSGNNHHGGPIGHQNELFEFDFEAFVNQMGA